MPCFNEVMLMLDFNKNNDLSLSTHVQTVSFQELYGLHVGSQIANSHGSQSDRFRPVLA